MSMSDTTKKPGWFKRTFGRKPARQADLSEQMQAVSPETRRVARKAVGQFSVTYDDVAQYYRLVAAPTSYLYPSTIGVAWQDTELDRLLRASAWSWACVNGNCKAMAQLTPVVQERSGGKWTAAKDSHPLNAFIEDPLGADAAFPFWPWQHLLYVTALHSYVVGNAYWLPVDALGGMSVIPIMEPHRVEADEDKIYHAPTLYRLRRSWGGESRWAPDKIVNISMPSAGSLWRGTAPLQAALRSVEIDQVATERQRYNLLNRVSPGLTVSLDRPLGPTPAQRIEAKRELLDDYQDVTDDGLPWIIGSGAKVTKGFSPEELQVFDTKDSSRAEIMATIGMQPSIMGQLDRATYSNTKEATLLWWYSSIQPMLSAIYGHINAQLVRPRYGSGTRLWYQIAGSNIGLQLLLAKLDAAKAFSGLGLSTEDVAGMLEIDIPDRDYLKIPLVGLVQSGRIPAPEEPAAPDDDPPADDGEDGEDLPE
jgi:phage portal protein BeeE